MAQIAGLGMRAVRVPVVPTRRVIGLARYGLEAKAPKLARHPDQRMRLETLLGQRYPVREADAARLSVYQHAHINVHGHYSFTVPDLAGGRRPPRDPDAQAGGW